MKAAERKIKSCLRRICEKIGIMMQKITDFAKETNLTV